MKVKLLKPFCGRAVGSIVTMHPLNARAYAQEGVCEAITEKEQAYLDKGIPRRRRVVETQAGSKATENTSKIPEFGKKPRTPRKPRDKTSGRRKS